MPDDETIEAHADDAVNEMDDIVEGWSIADALSFYEYVESNVSLRINGLRADLQKEDEEL